MADTVHKVTINGKIVEVPSGTSVFQAAEKAGIFIPHYCYHPDLSIAGVCRMCTVEIEKNPRLQISCNTPTTDGMVVFTQTEKVKAAVKSALELHLINHPIDCPICDKAGECKLQDFYSAYGLYSSRMKFDKVHKPKVVDIGTIMLDAERCILCTRCVRFTEEVTQTNELGIFNRGDRSVLGTYDGKALRNDYTGNLADICPVGALTAKDFRFKQRVWFLEKVKTVCTLCSTGCNTSVSINPSTKNLFRVEPRRNVEVNRSWICDKGRWDFHYVHKENRLKVPLLFEEEKWVERTWDQFFKSVTPKLEDLFVVMSTTATNEEIADAIVTFKELGVTELGWIVDEKTLIKKEPYDGILQRQDSTSNTTGFIKIMENLKQTFYKFSDIKKVKKKNLLILGLENENPSGLLKFSEFFPTFSSVAIHATQVPEEILKAHRNIEWVLPNCSSYEKKGTLVNALNRFQKLDSVLPKQYISRDIHGVVFGIKHGNDRHAVSENRAVEVYDGMVKKFFNTETIFRKMDPLGVLA